MRTLKERFITAWAVGLATLAGCGTSPEPTPAPVHVTPRSSEAEPPAGAVVVYGDLRGFGLRALAERVRDDLAADPRVERAEIVGPQPELRIETAGEALDVYGLTEADVARVVAGLGEDERNNLEALEQLSVEAPDGTKVPLSYLATITLALSEEEPREVDGQRAIEVRLRRADSISAGELGQAIDAYVAQTQESLPPTVSLRTVP